MESPTSSSDGTGGVISGWTEEFQCRAKFLYLRGGESVRSARLEGRQPVVATVRANTNTRQITTAWRFLDQRKSDLVYNIRAIVEADDRQYLEITAESGVPT
ncbi:MAG: phage head-tail adapter protein [Rhodobacteraceae bacterium]|nr:phage head-tail adapter protein [Paracoccaceae bacterium]